MQPTTPVATPQTTRVIIPTAVPEGWVRIEGKGVAMRLPDTFKGGNMEDYAAQISARSSQEFSPGAAVMLQEALKNPDQFAFLAFETPTGKKFLTNINIVKSRFSNERHPLDEILQATIAQYPKDFKILESAVVKINELVVIRMVVSLKMQTTTTKQLQYIRIDDNNDAWITNYSTSPEEFNTWLPIFEKSYQSLELLPAAT